MYQAEASNEMDLKITDKLQTHEKKLDAKIELLEKNINEALKNIKENGININKTNPILSDAMRIGGTESFKTNLVKGNALP